MKGIKFASFFLFAVLCCISYAHENKYIFVGQNNDEVNPSFILDLLGEDLNHYFHINENGEIFLKADKIIAIPKDKLSQVQNVTSMINSSRENNETERVKCTNCGTVYWATSGNRNCPNCGRYNWSSKVVHPL